MLEPNLEKSLNVAVEYATEKGHEFVSLEHILLTLIKQNEEENCNEFVFQQQFYGMPEITKLAKKRNILLEIEGQKITEGWFVNQRDCFTS